MKASVYRIFLLESIYFMPFSQEQTDLNLGVITVELSINDNVAVIALRDGWADDYRETLRNYIADLTQTEPTLIGVVLNLEMVTMIDSQALGLLIAIHRDLDNLGKKFGLCYMSDTNLEVLRLTQLDRVLIPYPTASYAVEAMNK